MSQSYIVFGLFIGFITYLLPFVITIIHHSIGCPLTIFSTFSISKENHIFQLFWLSLFLTTQGFLLVGTVAFVTKLFPKSGWGMEQPLFFLLLWLRNHCPVLIKKKIKMWSSTLALKPLFCYRAGPPPLSIGIMIVATSGRKVQCNYLSKIASKVDKLDLEAVIIPCDHTVIAMFRLYLFAGRQIYVGGRVVWELGHDVGCCLSNFRSTESHSLCISVCLFYIKDSMTLL